MKYVIINVLGVEVAILFSEIQDHATFSNLNPVSAGFCTVINEYDVAVWGKSNSLKLQHREEDAEIIKKTLTFRG